MEVFDLESELAQPRYRDLIDIAKLVEMPLEPSVLSSSALVQL
jgi:hypothetical protein